MPPTFLLDDFAGGESWTNRVDSDLHMLAGSSLRNEDYETLDSGYAVATTANLLNVKFVFLPFLNRLAEGTLIAHLFHLIQLVQLVVREKTQTPTRMVTLRTLRLNPRT